MAKQKFYVVWSGKEAGIFTTWEECQPNVIGQVGAKYKSFKTRTEAEEAFSMGYDAYRASDLNLHRWFRIKLLSHKKSKSRLWVVNLKAGLFVCLLLHSEII